MPIYDICLAHELDAAWIIAVWRAIHGRDPNPEQVAVQAIAALAHYVSAPAQIPFSFAELKAQFARLGVQVTERSEDTARASAEVRLALSAGERQFCIHQYCFTFKGETFCTERPTLIHLPTAT